MPRSLACSSVAFLSDVVMPDTGEINTSPYQKNVKVITVEMKDYN